MLYKILNQGRVESLGSGGESRELLYKILYKGRIEGWGGTESWEAMWATCSAPKTRTRRQMASVTSPRMTTWRVPPRAGRPQQSAPRSPTRHGAGRDDVVSASGP